MAACTEKHHANHTHKHDANCGHTANRQMWTTCMMAISGAVQLA